MIYIQTDSSDNTVEDIISEEYLHVITDKKDEVLKLKNKCFWSIQIILSKKLCITLSDQNRIIRTKRVLDFIGSLKLMHKCL